ncbi:MAG: tagatose 1,6-diphosphate aldolase [Anaerolineae bacterium]
MKQNPPLGKVHGLRQIANRHGIVTILGLDQRGSLRRSLNPEAPMAVPAEMLIAFKMLLLRVLAPFASAVALDPLTGAGHAVASGALPGDVGLVVSQENSGYEGQAEARRTTLVAQWDVARSKQLGASAVKLLVYYRPEAATATEQVALVCDVAASCRIHDLPLLLQPLTYALGGSRDALATYRRERPHLVYDSLQHLAPAGPDLLIVEFPADLERHTTEEALDHCRRVTAGLPVPWILQSGAGDYDLFMRQVELACRAGASGFLAGRVLWQEMTRLPEREWEGFAASVSLERLQGLAAIANEEGRPVAPKVELSEDWYIGYGREAEAVPAALAD